jgi:hypothetical protein
VLVVIQLFVEFYVIPVFYFHHEYIVYRLKFEADIWEMSSDLLAPTNYFAVDYLI